MATRAFKRLAAPITVLVSVLALSMAMIGPATADPVTPPPPTSTANMSADNLGWKFQVVGSNVVNPGGTVTFQSDIWENSKAGGILNLGRYITAMRLIAPAGFEYVSGSVSMAHTLVDEGAGGVKAVCNQGGCSSVPVIGGAGFLVKGSTNLRFTAVFKVPDNTQAGDYFGGFNFDVYSFSSAQGGNPLGVGVRVVDDRVATTTTLDVPALAGLGATTPLKANVSPAGAVGNVQFFIDGLPTGTPQAVDPQGNAVLNHVFGEMASHTITAKFIAGPGYHNSEAAAAQLEVGNVVTTTTLTGPATATAGSSVSFEANVGPANPQGTVQFTLDGNPIGDAVSVVDGKAAMEHRFDDPGDHTVGANFVGAFGFEGSAAAPHALRVDYGAWQTTTVVVEPVAAESGSPTNLMATVRPIPTGGEVIFRVGGAEVGRSAVGTADGVAVLEHTFDTAGTYQVVAEFTGTTGFDPSTSTAFTATVTDAPPVPTSVGASLSVQGLAVEGQTATLTADVNPSNAVGTVQFYKGADAIGAPVPVVNGKASITTTLEFQGTQVLSAKFLGGEGFRDTVSNPVVLNVTAAPPAPEADAGSLGSLLESPLGAMLAGSIGG